MPILIDGHNLIGRLPTLSLQDPHDEERLISLLVPYRARKGKKVTVVFDPGGTHSLAQSTRRGGVEAVFAPYGSSADAVIARRVRQSRDPRGWLVITSDRDLAAAVLRQGARVQSAEAFISELEMPAEQSQEPKNEPLSPGEVDAWLALFDRQEKRDN